MRILVLGSGGREHAIVKTLKENSPGNEILVWEGNAGINKDALKIDADSMDNLLNKIDDMNIDLAVIGPEKYLEEGISDIIRDKNIPVIGPSRLSARLETTKVFAKNFMKRHNIPSPKYYYSFEEEHIRNNIRHFPLVLKYDGLAAGKGVTVCYDIKDVDKYLNEVFIKHKFGAGKSVIVEKFVEGDELTVICMVSKYDYHIFPPSRDHKRLLDYDKGPNTGGMGVVGGYSLINKNLMEQIENSIIKPTIDGLKKDDNDYTGFLYFGLILTQTGPQLLEYNCRLGDPEAQAVLPLIKGDFALYLKNAAEGKLDKNIIQFENKSTVCVIAASPGYPDNPEKGLKITGLDKIEDCLVYHSGTEEKDGEFYTAGGRVLGITAVNDDIASAKVKVYKEIAKLNWDGIHYRKDIG